MKTIYFDNAATTFPKPEMVYKAMDEVARKYGVNAGRGGYSLANRAGILIDETRELLADMVNASDYKRVIFTPSATIALNTVLFGLNWQQGDNVFYSPFEHNSVLRPLEVLKNKLHLNLHEIPINKENYNYDLIKLEEMYKLLKPRLTVVSHASNVCGLIAPIQEITSISHKYGGQVLIDGAQALGLLPVDLGEVKSDYYVFAGHKNLFGSFGIGGLIINNNELLEPLIVGGTGSNSEELIMPDEYPGRFEAASPNIVAIAGLKAGITWLRERRNTFDEEKKLLNIFMKVIDEYPEIQIVGPKDIEKILPVVSCTFDGYTPQEVALILDQNYNVAVRAGLHCAPKAHSFLGTSPNGTVRFSLGTFNTEEEILLFRDILEDIIY